MLNHKGEPVKVGDTCHWCWGDGKTRQRVGLGDSGKCPICDGTGKITARRVEIEQRIDDYAARQMLADEKI